MTLIVNHLLSFMVVMTCWWNAHLTASSREVWARISALGYGAVAVATITIAFFRQFGLETEWVSVLFKIALLGLFVTIALRKTARARGRSAA
jgi:hypothetical protein